MKARGLKVTADDGLTSGLTTREDRRSMSEKGNGLDAPRKRMAYEPLFGGFWNRHAAAHDWIPFLLDRKLVAARFIRYIEQRYSEPRYS